VSAALSDVSKAVIFYSEQLEVKRPELRQRFDEIYAVLNIARLNASTPAS
jgi:hypothetical protein